MGRALAETDVLVVPSLWYENSPVVIQEAFAAGVPVIASDVGALPEKVGSAGWLFPVGDANRLQELLKDIISAGSWKGGAGAKGAPKPIADAVGQLLEIYSEVLLSSPKPRGGALG